jgi:hypothetical protein
VHRNLLGSNPRWGICCSDEPFVVFPIPYTCGRVLRRLGHDRIVQNALSVLSVTLPPQGDRRLGRPRHGRGDSFGTRCESEVGTSCEHDTKEREGSLQPERRLAYQEVLSGWQWEASVVILCLEDDEPRSLRAGRSKGRSSSPCGIKNCHFCISPRQNSGRHTRPHYPVGTGGKAAGS